MVRPWKIGDWAEAKFICSVRNNLLIRRWAKEDEDISVEKQMMFMAKSPWYGGCVIEFKGKPVGVMNQKDDGEFGIAILPQWQRKGIATEAMTHLPEEAWGEVFVDNPALSFYLTKCGFKAVGVRERAYHKRDIGLVDIVLIERNPWTLQ